jgi:hypothetical protein
MTSNIPCPVCKTIVPFPATHDGELLCCPKCQLRFKTTGPTPAPCEIPVLEAVDPIPEVLPVSPALTVQPTPPPRTNAKLPTDVLWWRGNCIDGLNAQAGVIVLRRDMVVFMPTEKAKNLVGLLTKGLVDAASPFQTISLDWLRSRPDPLQMVRDLWDERPDDFDRCIIEIADHLGGWAWPRIVVRVARPRKGGRSEGVIFTQGPTELRGYAPGGEVLERLLKGWQETDEPILGTVIAMFVISLLPLFMAAATYIAHFFTTDIPWWGALIWVGMAGLLYVAVGIKVAWVWLRRKRRPTTESSITSTGSE